MTDRAQAVERLRQAGWSVAVHNDYRLHGEPHTFWLFTNPDGRWAKGEGKTDAEALAQVEVAALLSSPQTPAAGEGEAPEDWRELMAEACGVLLGRADGDADWRDLAARLKSAALSRPSPTAGGRGELGSVGMACPSDTPPSPSSLGRDCEPSSGGWQPIETAPDDGTEVLLWCPADEPKAVAAFYYREGDEWSGWVFADDLLNDVAPEGPTDPTHWAPITPPDGSRHPVEEG